MSIAVYILSVSVVGTGTLLGLCVRKYSRELAQTIISTANLLTAALSQHQNTVVSSLAQHQNAVANALGEFQTETGTALTASSDAATKLADALKSDRVLKLGFALTANNEALEKFANSIPSGAKVFTHVKDTSGSTTLKESHTVQFK
jgi:exonuclease VII large subunit